MKNKKKYTIKFTGYHFKKVCRETVNTNNRLLLVLFDIIKSKKKGYIPPTYIPPKEDYWPLKPSKEVVLYKKPTKRIITLGPKRRS